MRLRRIVYGETFRKSSETFEMAGEANVRILSGAAR